MRPLEDIEATAAAASAAPWEADMVWSDKGGVDIGYPEGDDRCLTDHLYIYVAGPNREANAEFIANARQDVPDLLATVAALTAENERLRDLWREVLDDALSFISQEFGHCEKCQGDGTGWDYDTNTYSHTPDCIVSRARAALEVKSGE